MEDQIAFTIAKGDLHAEYPRSQSNQEILEVFQLLLTRASA